MRGILSKIMQSMFSEINDFIRGVASGKGGHIGCISKN